WPDLKAKLAAVFRTKTRDEWSAILDGTDACAAPVMTLAEAPSHPHLAARGAFQQATGGLCPTPAPRFSAHAPRPPAPPAPAPMTLDAALADWSAR
ncbi:MAG: CoA transferase, partial [Pseudomonadota bacterium]|nr:CoA transferase [Pseudomonadota bacterium]